MAGIIVVFLASAAAAAAQDGNGPKVRAAGMPLQDGALPPGMLTVRVVRGAFAGNVPGQQIHLELRGGDVRSGTTNADGRAEFAHLPIGAEVRAYAEIGGERMESDFFAVPAEAGVRLLFVANENANVPVAPPQSMPPATAAAAVEAPGQAAAAPARSGSASDLALVRTVVGAITLSAFALVLGRRLVPRRKA